MKHENNELLKEETLKEHTLSFWNLQRGNRASLWHYDDYKNIKNLGRLWTCSSFSCQVLSCQFLVVVCTCLFMCIFHICLLHKFDTFVCFYTSKFCFIFKINVFWDMMSCSLVHRYQHFVTSFVDVREEKDVRFLSTKLHDTTDQKITFWNPLPWKYHVIYLLSIDPYRITKSIWML